MVGNFLTIGNNSSQVLTGHAAAETDVQSIHRRRHNRGVHSSTVTNLVDNGTSLHVEAVDKEGEG